METETTNTDDKSDVKETIKDVKEEINDAVEENNKRNFINV